ncbi:DUF4261 domain-containing protein [Roseiconus nitratireducens]|nr:DUF4261 domain-containing protein [Roseiconus nitratireducens]
MMVCMVLFSDEPEFDRDKWQECVSGKLPGGIQVDQITDKENICQIDLIGKEGDPKPGSFFVSRMPAFPADDDEPGTLLWPDAAEEIPSNQSHWIIPTAESELSPVQEALLLTRIVDAILRSHPTAVGVLWNRHGLKISSENFRGIVDSLDPGAIPSSLWIGIEIVPGQDQDAATSAFTTGMDAFDLMEVEAVGAPEPPEELFLRIDSVCQYLLENGPVLRHGDTLGETEHERIRVLHANSAFGREGKVIQLKYGGEEPGAVSPPDDGSPLKAILALVGMLLAAGLLVFGIVKGIGVLVAGGQDDLQAAASAPFQRRLAEPAAAPPPVQPDADAPQTPAPSPADRQPTVNSNTMASNTNQPDEPSSTEVAPEQPPAADDASEDSADPSADPKTATPEPEIRSPQPEQETAADASSEESLQERIDDPQQSNTNGDPTRFWRNRNGAVLHRAEIIAVKRVDDITLVRLLEARGEFVEVPYLELSNEDQEYAKRWYKDQAAKDATAGSEDATMPEVGDKVRVKWGSRWWDGEIIEIDGDRFKFSYEGWSSQWDEWKKADQLRWPDDTPVVGETPDPQSP